MKKVDMPINWLWLLTSFNVGKFSFAIEGGTTKEVCLVMAIIDIMGCVEDMAIIEYPLARNPKNG